MIGFVLQLGYIVTIIWNEKILGENTWILKYNFLPYNIFSKFIFSNKLLYHFNEYNLFNFFMLLAFGYTNLNQNEYHGITCLN